MSSPATMTPSVQADELYFDNEAPGPRPWAWRVLGKQGRHGKKWDTWHEVPPDQVEPVWEDLGLAERWVRLCLAPIRPLATGDVTRR